jgi:hypothetical protein
MNQDRRAALLAPVLVLTTMVASVVGSLGALIPTVAKDFHDSLSTAQWSPSLRAPSAPR